MRKWRSAEIQFKSCTAYIMPAQSNLQLSIYHSFWGITGASRNHVSHGLSVSQHVTATKWLDTWHIWM